MTDSSRPGPPLQPEERFADDQRRYRLDARIATGGMGEVWRGTDTQLGRPVAIKLLKSEYADDPAFRSRFVTEARHAAALHHPGVAGVFDFGEAAAGDGSGLPQPFLVMELVEGQPLSALLRGGRPLDPEAVRDLMAQAADAIGAAHRAGIVHRDVKPANLLVTPDRRIKITDFGIARASDGLGLTGTGQVMGTPQYLSPEQARGGTATSASDVYSLGVVAFECLSGRRPFDADSPVATALAHLNDPVPDLPGTVPPDLAAVVRRAMSKEPRDRYPDGEAFAAALRDPSDAAATAVVPATPAVAERTQVLGAVPPGTGPLPAPVPAPVPEPPRTDDEDTGRRFWPVALLLVGLVAAAAVAIVWVATTGEDGNPETAAESPTRTATRTPTRTESTPTTPTTQSSPDTFSIDPGDYIGRDVDQVAAELRDRGLSVDTQEVRNPGDEEPDAVESVHPTQNLSEGDTVTVTYFGEPPETTEPTHPTEPTSPTGPTGTGSPTPGNGQGGGPTVTTPTGGATTPSRAAPAPREGGR